MPPIPTSLLTAMVGAGAGALWGINRRVPEGSEPGRRFANIAQAVFLGAAAGYAGGMLGARRVGSIASGVGKTAMAGGKAVMWNPLAKGGYGFRLGIKGRSAALKGTMGALALGVGTGAAFSAGMFKRSDYPTTVARREGSVGERMDMMGADGGMVFGLNNLRHGG